MSFFERSRGRYTHPFDIMADAISRFDEAFSAFSDSLMPRYRDRLLDRPSLERYPYDRDYYERLDEERYPERWSRRRDKIQKKELEREKEPEEKGGEKADKVALKKSSESDSYHPLVRDLLERPMGEVLRAFEAPFFRSQWESHSTFDRAHKLLNEMLTKGKPDVNIPPEDELLQVPEDLEKMYREFGDKPGAKLSGTSYQTSNITKDGKTVTVVRQSKLNPDGSISTKVSQHFDDGEGHRDTISRKKTINVKSGETSNKIVSEPEKKAIIEEEAPLKKLDEEKTTKESSKKEKEKEKEKMQEEKKSGK